jgi:hypothetical protein
MGMKGAPKDTVSAKKRECTKKYLSEYLKIDTDIEVLKVNGDYEYSKVAKPSLIAPTDKDPIQTSNITDSTGQTGRKLADIIYDTESEINRLLEIKCDIKDSISAVIDSSQRELLRRIYIYRSPDIGFDECMVAIADEKNRCLRAIQRVHSEALLTVFNGGNVPFHFMAENGYGDLYEGNL